jgi:hypothetical protein
MRTQLTAAVLPVLLALLPSPTRAADRVVLCEEFTRDTCGYCAYAGPALNLVLNAHPGTFVLLQIHTGDSAANAWGNARMSFYGLAGTPTAWFDGVTKIEGAGSTPEAYADYTAAYNARRAVPTHTTITGAAFTVAANTVTVTTHVGVEAEGAPQSMRVHMAQVIDYWPSTTSYHRYGLRQAAGYQDVTVNPGEAATVVRTFLLDGESVAHAANVKFIVWAQTPASSKPAEVFQAAVFGAPFAYDCNGNSIPDATDIATGASGDCNANGIPDECDIQGGVEEDLNQNSVPDACENVPGDLSCNGTVGFDDINPFVEALTCPTCFRNDHPLCNIRRGDINLDGFIDFADINPFVQLLTGP